MPRTAKLVLPNVETCPWRTLQGEAATCGLIASLLGQCSATVSLEACTACCRSFPPTHRHLNPVVASLLYRAGSEILAAEGTDECDTDRARDVLRQAERSLMIVHPPGMTVTPARLTESCHWLGQPIGTESAASTAEPEWDCLHPSHTVTTSAQCRTCRDWIRQPPISRFLSLSELVPPPRRRCGNKVKEWAVAVTTAPRREPTLAACLDSLVTAGWDRARLFLDGTAPLPDRYSDWPVTWREESVGAWPAWYFALAELVLQQPQADAYVMLQDDVALYPRESLRAYLEEVLWPGDRPGVISLFYTGLNPSTGWFDAKGAWHFSAAGLIFSAGVARTFLCDSDVTRSLLAASGHTHIPIPEILHQWINRQGIDLWYANPSLAQHMGNTSTIWMNAALVNGRRAPWFSGSLEAPFSAKETLDEFPEDAFQCPTATAAEYVQRVENGRRRMRELSVVVCGLCRDVRNFLPRTAARVERLGAMFRDYRVVLFENDSVDATCEFLADWQTHNPRVEFISEAAGVRRYAQTRSLDRAQWLARCRNRYRERVLERYADFDYVIVVDTDLPGGWSYDGIAHSFGGEEWDFVGSYGIQRQLHRDPARLPYLHFDVWAFHPAIGTPARSLVNHNELVLHRGDPLLPVESCFGGLGIYRMACMQAAEYGGGDCEHVVMHERLRRAGYDRLFLNPNQIVLYSP